MNIESSLVALSLQHPIVLFDGLCLLCDRSIQWVIKHDEKEKFKFCNLQLAMKNDNLSSMINTVVLIYNGETYIKSDAVLMILEILGSKYGYITKFSKWIPRRIRDFVYDIIAKYRYQFFGKFDHCMIPNQSLKKRFITELNS